MLKSGKSLFFILAIILTYLNTYAQTIAAGSDHSLAVCNGTIWAWGSNHFGKLGDGTNIDRYSPVQIQILSNVTGVAGGVLHTLALKGDGTVWAWGINNSGCLGNGATADTNAPARVANLNDIIVIAAGYSHSIALKKDGTVWTWGANNLGQLGDSTKQEHHIPTKSVHYQV